MNDYDNYYNPPSVSSYDDYDDNNSDGISIDMDTIDEINITVQDIASSVAETLSARRDDDDYGNSYYSTSDSYWDGGDDDD